MKGTSGAMERVDWQGKRVVVVGAARQGTALARYLYNHGAQVILNDHRLDDAIRPSLGDLVELANQADVGSLTFAFGGHPLDLLEGTDLLCLSGGVPLTIPLVDQAVRRGISLSNDSQVFMEAAPCQVIGITGSAGKTTTTTLVGRMAQETVIRDLPHVARRAWIGGNIGKPLITDVDQMQADDLVVMELSSFQLELMTRSPQVAAILNITPNHLDRHHSMQAYAAAKTRILAFQSEGDTAVLGRDDPGAWELAEVVRGRLFTFGLRRPADRLQPYQAGTYVRDDILYLWDGSQEVALMDRSVIRLRGAHNLLNVLAACAIAAAAGYPVEAMQAGVEGFSGVAHRLEYVRSYRGADWYNDSKATTPEGAIAAIRSFDEPLVVLAGGRDKNLPWEDFARLVHQRVDHLVLFGEAAEKIERALKSVDHEGRPMTVARCNGLREAVQEAAQIANAGDVILLSPGGTSFDEFRDFEERGEAFRKWVNELS